MVATTISRLHTEEQLSHTLLRYKNLVENTDDIIFTITPEGVITHVSPNWTEKLGYTEEETIGTHLNKFVHPKDTAQCIDFIKHVTIHKKKAESLEYRVIHADGKISWYVSNVSPLLDTGGTVLEINAIAHNISRIKQNEKKLQNAQKKAEEATRAKTAFLATMSHEIRTPLSGIIGCTELSKKRTLAPNTARYIDNIHTSGKMLLSIINNILDLSKIEAGELPIHTTETDLSRITYDILEMVKHTAFKNETEVILDFPEDAPQFVQTDPLRIKQILMNLVTNAIKFSPRGEVLLCLTATPHTPPSYTWTFSVSDTGIGMNKKEVKKIFTPFLQAKDDTTHHFGGTGLGLTISRLLVEKLGGTLRVESTPGMGSTFFFTLDLISEAKASSPVLISPPYTNAYIDPGIGKYTTYLLRKQLERYNITVETEIRNKADLCFFDAAAHVTDEADLKENGNSAHSVCLYNPFHAKDYTRIAQNNAACHLLPKPLTPEKITSLFQNITKEKHTQGTTETRTTILLVEDEELSMIILRHFFENYFPDIRVVEARTGIEALKAVQAYTIRLILMDVQMPELDGIETAKIIRQSICKETPIIAVTARATMAEKRRCLAAGMNHFLVKPLNENSLYPLCKTYLKADTSSTWQSTPSYP
ncbi:PAS domain-containing hybrid sensor histidine kinase/response regulator [Chitinivibrio alkaliphilus]|uniref:histidine kinase n=1 Tax=Chitinivibrio alkaliphilus ACht1 TaxID=1313304 RepID=U7D669_9BACT|nr:ATP-binding protein [Chitinivibrio alkaliphilus]ERP31071.1 PAS/PAC sensor hybrid histidine kinase [Chitinivibrio alkaliphilus ACht1]